MKAALALAGIALTATTAFAERQDVSLTVDDKVAEIAEVGGIEVLSVGYPDDGLLDILSGADLEIVAMADGPDTTALFGGAILVVAAAGTHSCEDGDALDYYVVKLGLMPGEPQGPVTACGPLVVTIADGVVTLAAEPGRKDADSWTWASASGFSLKAN